jgi:2'-5' RNA ligase
VKRDPQPEHLVTLGELLNNLPPLPFLAWHASQISLFQSSLTASGPVYTVLGGMQLALPDRSNPTSVVNRS